MSFWLFLVFFFEILHLSYNYIFIVKGFTKTSCSACIYNYILRKFQVKWRRFLDHVDPIFFSINSLVVIFQRKKGSIWTSVYIIYFDYYSCREYDAKKDNWSICVKFFFFLLVVLVYSIIWHIEKNAIHN